MQSRELLFEFPSGRRQLRSPARRRVLRCGERLLHFGKVTLQGFLFRDKFRASPLCGDPRFLGGVAGFREPGFQFSLRCGERRDFLPRGTAQLGERVFRVIQLALQFGLRGNDPLLSFAELSPGVGEFTVRRVGFLLRLGQHARGFRQTLLQSRLRFREL